MTPSRRHQTRFFTNIGHLQWPEITSSFGVCTDTAALCITPFHMLY